MNIKTPALTVLFLCGVSAGAMAAPMIASGSTINFTGNSTCTSSTCSFSAATVQGSGTGSFVSFTDTNPATFANFTFNPFTSQQVYTTTEAGLTTTFTVTSQLSSTQTMAGPFTLTTVVDSGIATLTGFDSTPGSYVFTANQNGSVTGSFSATETASAIPEPISMSMLGAGLIGMGVIRLRRKN